MRAQAESSLDRPLDAVTSLVEREKHLVVKADLARNQQHIWQLLQSAKPRRARRRVASAVTRCCAAGWSWR